MNDGGAGYYCSQENLCKILYFKDTIGDFMKKILTFASGNHLL